MNRTVFTACCLSYVALALSLTGCNNEAATKDSNATASVKLPDGLFLKSPPANPRGVTEVKADAAADSEVVMRGRIGGRADPFVGGRAVFVLADRQLPVCGEVEKDDHCKTPWDYCCESAETRTANSLLVEVRDAKGKPLAGSLGDLRLLDVVTVVGKLTKDVLEAVDGRTKKKASKKKAAKTESTDDTDNTDKSITVIRVHLWLKK